MASWRLLALGLRKIAEDTEVGWSRRAQISVKSFQGERPSCFSVMISQSHVKSLGAITSVKGIELVALNLDILPVSEGGHTNGHM